MESAIWLYKTELIDRATSRTRRAEVERETPSWVHWTFESLARVRLTDAVSPGPYPREFRDDVVRVARQAEGGAGRADRHGFRCALRTHDGLSYDPMVVLASAFRGPLNRSDRRRQSRKKYQFLEKYCGIMGGFEYSP